jgi:hypothetical protein
MSAESPACIVCDLPALPESYVVRYEGGEVPPIAGVRFHLCAPHRDALALAPRRPVVSYADDAREALGLAQKPQDRR